MINLIQGDCLSELAKLPEKSIHTCITSPPYFGLRDYGVDGQMGLEPTPEAYIENMVNVFREVRRILRDDGTLWLNLGDSYAGSGKGRNADGTHSEGGKQSTNTGSIIGGLTKNNSYNGLKPKDLIGIPWRVALALQADGWYLRQDIIWHKPNPMPESVKDRCTKAHEYIFLLSKSQKYYFDAEAIMEPVAQSTISRMAQNLENQSGSDRVPFKTNGNMKAVGNAKTRNHRSVWTVSTRPYKGAHFATFPPDLIRPCVLAGCPKGGVVLDPFGGSGTTGMVALEEGRKAVLIELNSDYIELIKERISKIQLTLF